MNKQDSKRTHVLIKEDRATGITSKAYNANIDAVGFNLDFILSKDPSLVIAIMELYKKASAINPDDPPYPEEDYLAALDKIKNTFN